MRRPARLYAAKEHTPEEIAGMREVCKVRLSSLFSWVGLFEMVGNKSSRR